MNPVRVTINGRDFWIQKYETVKLLNRRLMGKYHESDPRTQHSIAAVLFQANRVIVYTQLSGIDPQLHNDFFQEAYFQFKKRLDTADPNRMDSFESTIKAGARRARSNILDGVVRDKRFVNMEPNDMANLAVTAQVADTPLTEIVASSREKIGLSDLEFSVLGLHAEGYNGKEIAAKLDRPYVTVVTNHRRAIRKIRNWISSTNYRREDG